MDTSQFLVKRIEREPASEWKLIVWQIAHQLKFLRVQISPIRIVCEEFPLMIYSLSILIKTHTFLTVHVFDTEKYEKLVDKPEQLSKIDEPMLILIRLLKIASLLFRNSQLISLYLFFFKKGPQCHQKCFSIFDRHIFPCVCGSSDPGYQKCVYSRSPFWK